MSDFLKFLNKSKNTLLFIILELIASYFIIRGYYYHNMQFINTSNFFTSNLLSVEGMFNNQLHLENENQRLIQENVALRNKKNQLEDLIKNDTSHIFVKNSDVYSRQEYRYINAKVLHNSIYRNQNFITLNKGSNDGIKKDMAVITDRGIIGVVDNVSANYSVVKSILNYNKSITGALVKNKNAVGTLVWNKKDYRTISLVGIPKYKKVAVGDIVLSTNISDIYPSGIPIGKVINVSIDPSTHQTVSLVALFQNFSDLSNVYIVNELHKYEFSEMLNDSIKPIQ